LLDILNRLHVVGTGTVPLKKGELGIMLSAPLAFAEAVANLENLPVTSGEKLFHMEFRGCRQKPVLATEGDNIQLRGDGRRTDGSLYLDEALLTEEVADGVINQRPPFQVWSDTNQSLPLILCHTLFFRADPLHISPGAGINLNDVALFDKGRHTDAIACFQDSLFILRGNGGSLGGYPGFHYLKVNGNG